MKLTAVISLLSLSLPAALADFHIDTLYNSVVTSGSTQQHWTSYVACPSDYWNCQCLTDSDRTGSIFNGNPGDSFFSIKSGFCGMDQMNFYQDGDNYDFYINGGDGSKIGTCYPNTEPKECGIVGGTSEVMGGMVCYSYACNP